MTETPVDVVGFSIDEADFCGIKETLQPLIEHEDRFAAAKGSMLLKLVEHLRNSRPEPRLVAFLSFDELSLWPAGGGSAVSVGIRIDWYDYAQWDGDLPVMHYRVRIPGLSPEVRSRDPEEVERFLRKAFEKDQE